MPRVQVLRTNTTKNEMYWYLNFQSGQCGLLEVYNLVLQPSSATISVVQASCPYGTCSGQDGGGILSGSSASFSVAGQVHPLTPPSFPFPAQ